ncbi:hypothetical protein ACFL67_04425 [candidate division KSB1 bacterium]
MKRIMNNTEKKEQETTGKKSTVKRTYPVIMTDAPFRVEPGMPLPFVCSVRLLTESAVIIESINVKLTQNNQTVLSSTVLQRPAIIRDPIWRRVFVINLPEDLSGEFALDAFIRVGFSGKTKTIHNCDEPGIKNSELKIFRAKEKLPKIQGYCLGDLHYHSMADSSGIPHTLPQSIAHAIGLDFYTVAMLSFKNGDSGVDNVREYHRFKRSIIDFNEKSEVVALAGQEASCRNAKGKTVPLLVLNGAEYIEGTAESPARLMPGRSKYTLKDGIKKAGESSAVFALHPVLRRSRWRDVISRRGYWSLKDIESSGICGMQVSSLASSLPDDPGLREWIKLLLQGHKRFIIAGSHAQQTLSYRPFKKYPNPDNKTDDPNRVFGYMRTGILCGSLLTADGIIKALLGGRAVVTNGPLLDIVIINDSEKRVRIGGELNGSSFLLRYRARTTAEFGPVSKILLYAGDIKNRREDLIFTFNFKDSVYTQEQEIYFEPRSEYGYMRGELWTRKEPASKFCITNPIWIREENRETRH